MHLFIYRSTLINHSDWLSRYLGCLDSFRLLVGPNFSMLLYYHISSISSYFSKTISFSYFIILKLHFAHSSYPQPWTTQHCTNLLQLSSPSPNLLQLIFPLLIVYSYPSRFPKVPCLPQIFCIHRNFPSSSETYQHLSHKPYH